MNLEELYDMVSRTYQGVNTIDMPLVLTIINGDGTVTAHEVEGAGILFSGHPSGNGQQVANLIIYPPR